MASAVSYNAGFWAEFAEKRAGVIAILIIRERNKAKVGKFKFAGFQDHHFGRNFDLIAGAEIVKMDGQIGHCATACGPRICTHQPLFTKLFTILAAKANEAFVHRYFSVIRAFDFFHIVKAAYRHRVRPIEERPSTRGITNPTLAAVIRIAGTTSI